MPGELKECSHCPFLSLCPVFAYFLSQTYREGGVKERDTLPSGAFICRFYKATDFISALHWVMIFRYGGYWLQACLIDYLQEDNAPNSLHCQWVLLAPNILGNLFCGNKQTGKHFPEAQSSEESPAWIDQEYTIITYYILGKLFSFFFF